MPSLFAIDPLPALVACAWIGALLLQAGAGKLADRPLFHQHLAAYGVPEALQPALVWALPLAEIACALGLATPWRGAAAGASAALFGIYGAAMAWHLAQGQVLDCGCGGPPLRLSPALVLRNAGLVALAGVVALPTQPRAIGPADAAVAAAALVLGALLWSVAHQVLRRQAPRPPSSSSWPGSAA